MKLLLAIILALVAAPAAFASPVETTVCEIVQNPGKFNGKTVRLRADVSTDWQHFTALVEEGCQRDIALGYAEAMPREQQEALDRAIGAPMDERVASATFTGKYLWKPFAPEERQHLFQTEHIFIADLAHDIKVRPQE